MDNYERWEQHEAEQQRALDKLPICSECGEPIQDEYCYEIDGEYICEECINNHRKSIDTIEKGD